MSTDPAEPPFVGHKRYYMLLKIAVLLIAVALALRYVLLAVGLS